MVPAYSTLGWTTGLGGDPLLNTFIQWPSPTWRWCSMSWPTRWRMRRTTRRSTRSFATAVERLGPGPLAVSQGKHLCPDPAIRATAAQFKALTRRTRQALAETLYASPLSDDEKRRRKAELMAAMRAEHLALKAGLGWPAQPPMTSGPTMRRCSRRPPMMAWCPDFERLFEREGRDFDASIAEVRRLAVFAWR